MASLTEGLPLGKKFVSKGRTIGEGDFTLLTNLTWTTSPIHADAQYMKSTQFGDRILAGPCVLSVVVGLSSTSGVQDALWDGKHRLVALLGFEDVRFLSPVLPGDTLTVESEIVDARPTKKANRGVLRIKDVARNQKGQVVMEGVRAELFEVSR